MKTQASGLRPRSPRSARIMVVGSSNTDMIIKLRRIPRPGETLMGGEFITAAGGKGANQAVAASRAGGKVSLIARIGRDNLGDQALAGLIKDRIDVSHVMRDSRHASGAALIFVADNGENSIAVAGGANGFLSPADIRRAGATIVRADVLLMQLETPLETVRAAARIAVAKGVTVILNPAPAQALPDDLLRHVSILTPNESEAELLTGIKLNSIAAAEKAAAKLRRRGVKIAVLTLGARGALIANDDGTRLIPGFRVKAVDTTAAGDVFNGVLAVALTEGRAIDDAVAMASAAAAISVTRWGAQPSAPKRAEILKFAKTRSRGAFRHHD
jgi:ribokinase